MKTVAIVGSHERTRGRAPYDDQSIEIWGFNSTPVGDWCRRLTAIFELHKPEEYTFSWDNKALYWNWLKNNRTVRVYMQETDYKVPMSRKYPLEEICTRFLSHLKRGDAINRYFTSSPCYALALAAYQGFERVEIYGIEMETNTEYIYQREGVGLWVGICIGLGMEVVIPQECEMLNAPLYGYDQDHTGVTREELEEHMVLLMGQKEEMKKHVDQARGYMAAISGEIEAARNKGVPMSEITKNLGMKYAEAQAKLEKALFEFGGLEAQIYNDSFWMTKIEKHMIAQGHGQQVMALEAIKLT